MSKAKKEKFEEQLRSLQEDISMLSQKLSLPPNSVISHYSTYDNDLSTSRYGDDNNYMNHSKISKSSERESSGTTKGQLARLKKEVHSITQERDNALYKLERLQRENTELRAVANEVGRLKSTCAHLSQDNDALKLSLESSERIRKQQKELISILQKSQATLDASTSSSHHSLNGFSTIPISFSTTSSIASNSSVHSRDDDHARWLSYSRESKSDLNNSASLTPTNTHRPTKSKDSNHYSHKKSPKSTSSKTSGSSSAAKKSKPKVVHYAEGSESSRRVDLSSPMSQRSTGHSRLVSKGKTSESLLQDSYISQNSFRMHPERDFNHTLDNKANLAGRPPRPSSAPVTRSSESSLHFNLIKEKNRRKF